MLFFWYFHSLSSFCKLTISLFILLLSIGCPLIHEYSTSLLLCATTASARPLLSTWLNLKFNNLCSSYALLLILPFFVFPLCTCTRLVKRPVSYAALSVQNSPPCKVRSSNIHIFQIIIEISPPQAIQLTVCTCLCVCVCVCVCDVYVHVCEFVLTVFWFFAL